MPTQDEQLLKQLERFDRSRNLDALREAGRLVEARPESASGGPGDPASRKSKLVLWLKVLDRIDNKLNRKFDPEDLPSITSEPPPELGLPAGVDPSAITDPVARTKYEAAMESDRLKREDYDFQLELHKVNDDLTARFGKFIARDCRQPAAEREIRGEIDSVIINRDRKSELGRLIEELKK